MYDVNTILVTVLLSEYICTHNLYEVLFIIKARQHQNGAGLSNWTRKKGEETMSKYVFNGTETCIIIYTETNIRKKFRHTESSRATNFCARPNALQADRH